MGVVCKKNHQVFLGLIVGMGLTIIPGCKRKNIQPPYLRPLTSYVDYQKNKEEENVTLRAKKLSPQDCESLIGPHARRLFKKHRRRQPICPIQLSITNNDPQRSLSLEPKNISLSLTNAQTVVNRLQRDSFIQAFGGIAAGLFITGILAFGSIFALSASGMLLVIIGSMQALAPLAVLGGSALLVTPFFLVVGTPIVSTVKGIQTSKQNYKLKKEIEEHSLDQSLIVEPGETVDTLIFVEKQKYKEKFAISLTNPENEHERINFHVQLHRDSAH